MAIPTWLADDAPDGETAPSREELRRTSEAAAALSHPSRLDILAALARQSGPVSYTDLKDATQVTDNGEFNYHLRQLEAFVDDGDGTYALSDRGRRVAEAVLDGEAFIV